MQHTKYMQQVISLAQMIDETQTRPNPRVAAIVVKDGQVVGIGAHLKSGEAHAEIHALNQAQEKARGATIYVNLEPCAHFGKTPPCADAIINAGIAEVIVANLDPNPLVAGKGLQKLIDAGINVIVGILSTDAAQINQIFFHNIKTQLPYITVKAGMSLDAKLCSKTGHSQWITDIESRKDAHHYRAKHEGILVGVNTVITDNPSLTTHLIDGNARNPIRIILDSELKTPLASKVVQDKLAKTIIVTCNQESSLHREYLQYGVEVIQVTNMLDLKNILTLLYKHNIYSILVEGGEKIYSSFLDAKLVNQLITYISPQLIGSKDAKHLFAGNGFATLADNLKLKFTEIKQLGNDVKLVAQVIE